MKRQIQKIPFLKRKVPKWIINTVAFVCVMVVLSMVSALIDSNISTLLAKKDFHKANLQQVFDSESSLLQTDVTQKITSAIESFDYMELLSSFTNGISGALGDVVLAPLASKEEMVLFISCPILM